MINNREELQKRLSEINMNQKFVLFGAGKKGSKLADTLSRYDLLKSIIDNDVEKQGNMICGKVIISFEQYSNKYSDDFIVICASGKHAREIASLLEKKGYIYKENYEFSETFENEYLPMYIYNKNGTVFMSLSQITLTERCTLKCTKCAHACYATSKDSVDLTLEQAKCSADSFFKIIDYVQEFVLIGGEPLLYNNLIDIISYIGENYRQQIGIFSITTNGTIIPNNKLIQICKKNNVFFNISNYQLQIPRLKENYDKLEHIFCKNKIAYYLGNPEMDWYDYGFEEVERNATKEELISVFDDCKTPCHEIRENRLYFCVMARSVSDNLGMNIGKYDYLDLKSTYLEKIDLLEFILGYSKRGYLEMCNHCRGKDALNYIIPAAEQKK